MKEIIMSVRDLEDTVNRLAGCQAVLDAVRDVSDECCVSVEALSGVSDLLEMIRRDFQADIDCAEIYTETVTAEEQKNASKEDTTNVR